MQQYNAIKAKYPDALLLFRVGDFYETFSEDAVKTSKILGIVLTKRSNGAASEMELAGFPYHALDTYLPKLVRAGQRVAICDQLEDPKTTKTIVKRGVTELVSPGVTYNEKILENTHNNFLAVVHLTEDVSGVAFADVSTGTFFTARGKDAYIEKLLQNFKPSEVVLQKSMQKDFVARFGDGFYTYTLDQWAFQKEYAEEVLLKHFQTNSLKGFGIHQMDEMIVACGVALHYFGQMQQQTLSHITGIARIDEEQYVWLDKFTIRNLELVASPHENARTLVDVIDRTVTPMGARLLKRWILLPLKDIQTIQERHDAVAAFTLDESLRVQVATSLRHIGDIERMLSKIALRRISPREMVQLKRALSQIQPIKDNLAAVGNSTFNVLSEQLNPCNLLIQKIQDALVEDAPPLASKGGFIAKGFNQQLDDLRQVAFSGKDYLLKIQQREVEQTGISSLKIAFNNVFGYYIEVTNAHKNKVPESWIRKQTLVNAERYITPELKEYEDKILGAEEKIATIENEIFQEIISFTQNYIQPLQVNASVLSQLDCLLSFANVALDNNYTRPVVNDSLVLSITEGRHPVLEKQMPPGEAYIPNSIFLDQQTQQIIMITGPNMSGKSALLRQTALIVLMAQTGSFVPAKSAEIGWVDKLFTRVGASDNISSGESTFMVEMNETASILNNITQRSLVLLDEIGRGTSTYDGISIAWSIADFIHESKHARAKTLFATHYHELNEMTNTYSRIKNYNVAIKEAGNKILFLRKLVPGGSEHSFGIHVARMAGMPPHVINKAEKMLQLLEKAHSNTELLRNAGHQADKDAMQLSFFQLDDPLLEQIRDEILKTDVNTLTPVEALFKLNEIKTLLSKNKK
ncbi:MAG: DNA mismatch repair protein MutS [Bacteroidetes bacterium]|jgi:DNA mismatch repair protein MutS|nr:DNA mismatch repair protein MutS [Bacteroidota bacterium]MBX7239985.1 DNA mismatch repair protein MutS [Bacteroidia bacterium]MCW5919530.1 DNA mismatch repair protein MutS [Bacteroidota bacterium]HCI58028.1 DNA mismatch repair protein MutS [Bacteroidota bacterium]HMU77273.1 DNA mismatch repair protein MutS [Bacteroidia bacterium]